jgi:hypothetical protein
MLCKYIGVRAKRQNREVLRDLRSHVQESGQSKNLKISACYFLS